METSTFELEADHRFKFNFSFEEMKINDGYWVWIEQNHSIAIYDWKDRKRQSAQLMSIIVKKQDGKLFFLLEESPCALEMKRETVKSK